MSVRLDPLDRDAFAFSEAGKRFMVKSKTRFSFSSFVPFPLALFLALFLSLSLDVSHFVP